MGKPSKERDILELFFNESTKHWHFSEITKEANISDERANHWLNSLQKESLIKRVKPRGKMPYFIAKYDEADFFMKKRLYGLNRLQDSGLLSYLSSLKNAKTIVIFGSFARGDWHTKSDVDVFLFGDPGDLRFGTFWDHIGWKNSAREVQIFTYRNPKEIKDVSIHLMNNVLKGFFVKGSLHDLIKGNDKHKAVTRHFRRVPKERLPQAKK